MSKSQDTKFNGARFDKYNRPETDLFRLRRDIYWILSKDKDYTEEAANQHWDDYINKVTFEANERMAKRDAEREKTSKFELEEYEKTFVETLLPIINGRTHDWGDEVENPKDNSVRFKVRRAIGCGGYNKDKNKMRAEIAGKYLNSTLELWEGSGKDRWRIYVSFKLR